MAARVLDVVVRIVEEDVGPEGLDHLGQAGGALRDDLAGQLVGVDDDGAELAQKSRKARRDTGQSGPATQQQGNQSPTSTTRRNTRGGTR